MRVVHIAANHPAKDTRIFIKECRTLAAAGYDVQLLVANPPPEARIDGVTFHAIESPLRHHHMSYFWPLKLWRPIWRIYRDAIRLDADVYHLHESELVWIGLLLKRRGKTVIFDAHEDYPRQMLYLDDGRLHRKLFARCMCFYMTLLILLARLSFDGFVVTSPGIGKRFPASKTAHCYNFATLNELTDDLLASSPYDRRPANIFYVGGITVRRGLGVAIQALTHLPEAHDVRFVLGGQFNDPDYERVLTQLPGHERVDFQGWLDRASIRQHMGQARLGVVLFERNPHHAVAIPNKLYEYMGGGLPVIATHFKHWRQTLAEYGDVPYWVDDPDQPQEVAHVIQHILDNPAEAEARARRGREAIETRFNWENEAVKLLELYERLHGKQAD